MVPSNSDGESGFLFFRNSDRFGVAKYASIGNNFAPTLVNKMPSVVDALISNSANIVVYWDTVSNSVRAFSVLDWSFSEMVLVDGLDLGHMPKLPGKVIKLDKG